MWQVRNNIGGPRNNDFRKENVKIEPGVLADYITLSFKDGTAAEVEQLIPTSCVIDFSFIKPRLLDKNLVLSIFIYQDDEHEFDIEISRWGWCINKDAQFIVQPTDKKRFFDFSDYAEGKIILTNKTIQVTYNKNVATFNHDITKPTLHLNLWRLNGKPRNTEVQAKVTIT